MEAEMRGRLTAFWNSVKHGAYRAVSQWRDLAAGVVSRSVALLVHLAYSAVMTAWVVINVAVRWAAEYAYGRLMALWLWFRPWPMLVFSAVWRAMVYVYDGVVLSWLWFLAVNRGFSRWITAQMPQRRRYRMPIHVISWGLSWLLIGSAVLITTIPTWEETEQVWNLKHQYSITFLDRSGEVLGYRGGAMDTSYELQDYPPYLVKSVLATEDHRFYQHVGIDPIGLAGALWWNVNHRGQREKGGSTITQQVVKNIWLTPEHSLTRKITEAWLAIWMENHLGKDEILRLYFERAYMGAGNYGLSAAAAITLPSQSRTSQCQKLPCWQDCSRHQ